MDGSVIDSLTTYQMIEKAYTLAETSKFGQSVLLARVSELKPFFLNQFMTSLTSLAALEDVPQRTTRKSATSTALKVSFGVGPDHAVEKGLPDFFNHMLEDESEDQILEFMKKGAAILITGGIHDNIVGAASFVTMRDGLFIDLVAVSHGRHKNALTFPGKVSNFQHQGLETLLIILLCSTARVKCKANPDVYLKANDSDAPFYTRLGFVPVTGQPPVLPVSLASAVPAARQLDKTDTVLFVKRGTTLESLRRSKRAIAALTLSGLPNTDVHVAAMELANIKNTPPKPKFRPKLAKGAKQSKNKQKKERQKGTLLEKSIPIALSDSEDSLEDYNTYTPFAAAPPSDYILPTHDDWGPQTPAYAKFKAAKPVQSHLPSQAEVIAKYATDPDRTLGRNKVILKALEFQEDTRHMQTLKYPVFRKRYHVKFTPQQFLDLAAVADLKRPIQIVKPTRKEDTDDVAPPGSKKPRTEPVAEEVIVRVSSYLMPLGIGLEVLYNDESARLALVPTVRTVKVSVEYILQCTRPEISTWLEESLFGVRVQRILGENAPPSDALQSSFSGKVERDHVFLSIPQGHKMNLFRPVPPVPQAYDKAKVHLNHSQRKHDLKKQQRTITEIATANVAYYDARGNVTANMGERLKRDMKNLYLEYVPPPPKADTQIVKLKWVPSQNPLHAQQRREKGVWHGAYAVKLGTMESSTVLRQCVLLSEWVESEFSPPFRVECKNIATGGGDGKRKETRYLFVPAGDSHDVDADPPPPSELLVHVPVVYLQGNEDSCLRQSMASALDAMGFCHEAQVIASDHTMIGCTVELVQRAAVTVRKLFADANINMRKIFNHASSVEQIGQQDAAWPIVLVLQTSDGCYGTHAITTWRGMIFDSNSDCAMRWSQKALDWCSGKGSKCVGFSRAFQILPACYGERVPLATVFVGSFVCPGESKALRWIRLLPSKKRKGHYLVRDTKGIIKHMLPGQVVGTAVPGKTVAG